MKRDEQNDLLALGSVMRNGYSTIIANAGKVVAFITMFVAVVVTFTNVAFLDLRSESFTTTLTVMLMSAYLMYFSLEDTGEREGEESEDFKAASKRYLTAKKKITPDSVDSLRSFCLDYSKRELEYRRLSYLVEKGYSATDLAAFKAGKQFPPRARRVFRRADRLRAVKLTPAVLLSHKHGMMKSELTDPRGKKVIGALTSLIPSTICMIFTVSVILTAKDGMTLATVIEGIIKLSALPIVGFKGLLDGYGFAKDDKSLWLETKARLLESFISTEEKNQE